MVHEEQTKPAISRALMIPSHNHRQLTPAEFNRHFQLALDENKRWVKTSQCILTDVLAERYYQSISLKQACPGEGADLSADKLARVGHLCWDVLHESTDLESWVEAYRARYGYYPCSVS